MLDSCGRFILVGHKTLQIRPVDGISRFLGFTFGALLALLFFLGSLGGFLVVGRLCKEWVVKTQIFLWFLRSFVLFIINDFAYSSVHHTQSLLGDCVCYLYESTFCGCFHVPIFFVSVFVFFIIVTLVGMRWGVD